MNSEFLRSGRDYIPSLLSQGVEEVGRFVPPNKALQNSYDLPLGQLSAGRFSGVSPLNSFSDN